MAVLKLNGLARAALVALAMLAASSQIALAKITTLACTSENGYSAKLTQVIQAKNGPLNMAPLQCHAWKPPKREKQF
jgi:hypothetical protein